MKRSKSKETLHASSSKRARKPEEANRRSYFLPGDISSQILLRLPAKSIARLRCVSKSFCTLTLDASFIRSHACRATTTLIVQAKPFSHRSQIADLHVINPDGRTDNRVKRGATRIRVPYPVEGSLTLCGSCDGLLCFRDTHWRRPHFYVCNPLMRDWIALPDTDRNYWLWLCGFYFHPSRREYRLLFEVRGQSTTYRSMVLTLGTNTYRGIKSCEHIVSPLFPNNVLVNDSLHWIAFGGDGYAIVAFDVQREEFRRMSLQSGCSLTSRTPNHHLIKMGGSLGLCHITAVLEIWFLKDYEREVWIKQHTISFQCIFRSISLSAKEFQSFLPVLATTEEELIFTWEHAGLLDSVLIHYDFKTKEFKMVYGDGSMHPKNCMIFHVPYAESLISCKSAATLAGAARPCKF